MAKVGDSLMSPESGWRRYDDTESKLKFTGVWAVGGSNNNFYNSTHKTLTTVDRLNNKLTFKFYGTKLRFIGVFSPYGSENCFVIIDGVEYHFSQKNSSIVYTVLNFEVTDLPLGIHDVEITTSDVNTLYLDAIDIDVSGYILTEPGRPLTSIDPGWYRYDDTDTDIIYTEMTHTSNDSSYNSTHKIPKGSIGSVRIKFKATQFRIVGAQLASTIHIKYLLDGVIKYFNLTPVTETKFQVLLVEELGLTDTVHELELIYDESEGSTFYFDAIELNKQGFLMHPSLNQKFTLDEIKTPGDCISCEYMQVYSSLGLFNNLGKATKTTIPAGGSNTPNGKFYWIFVGYDRLGRKKLIADRNIHVSITHDLLNSNGYVHEAPIKFTSAQNLCVGGSAFSSGDYSIYIADNAFDDDPTNVWYSSQMNNIRGCYIGYKFNKPTKVGAVYYRHNDAIYSAVTGVVVQYSVDGSSWVNASSEVTTNVYSALLLVTENVEAQYWRIYATKGLMYSNLRWGLREVIMYGFNDQLDPEKCKTSIRLLSGGINANDVDNEWDKIIASSDLDGKIAPADNNIWHWAGTSSWTINTNTANNTHRTHRGNSSATAIANVASNTSNAAIGFRPVLLVESPTVEIQNFSLSRTAVFNNESGTNLSATLVDKENLDVSYRVHVNGKIVIPWTKAAPSPNNILTFISKNHFTIGVNKLQLDVRNADYQIKKLQYEVYMEDRDTIQFIRRFDFKDEYIVSPELKISQDKGVTLNGIGNGILISKWSTNTTGKATISSVEVDGTDDTYDTVSVTEDMYNPQIVGNGTVYEYDVDLSSMIKELKIILE